MVETESIGDHFSLRMSVERRGRVGGARSVLESRAPSQGKRGSPRQMLPCMSTLGSAVFKGQSKQPRIVAFWNARKQVVSKRTVGAL